MELLDVAGELYGLAPGEFTSVRNERSKQAKADGDKELSDAIKRLPKASTAAWVVNVLVRHETQQVEQVLDLGAALRKAQENLDGAELRELTKQRRQLTSAVTRQARALAADLGQRVSEAVAQQVEETLLAAMIDEDAAKAVRSGLLTEPLSATGVGAVDVSGSVALPSAIGVQAKPVPPPAKPKQPPKPKLEIVEDDTRAIDEAKRKVEEAESAADKAKRALTRAGKRVEKLEARALQLQAELDELRNRISDVEHKAEATDDELTAAEEERDAAEETLEDADKQAEKARAELAKLER